MMRRRPRKSSASKGEKRTNIVIVGGSQRGHIASAQCADIGEAAAAPAERLSSELLDEEVGCQARMAAVAVREIGRASCRERV